MRLLAVLLGLLLATVAGAGSQGAGSDGAQQALADCVHANLKTHGLDHLESSCPGLGQALIDLGLAEQLEGDWRDRISAASLWDLLRLARRYQADPPGDGPRVSLLPPILHALQEPAVPQSWWERFKTWLRSWLRQPEDGDVSWLSRLLPRLHVAPWVGRAIGYALIAGVITLAFVIIWREIKAARAQSVPPVRPPVGTARRRRETGAVRPEADTLDLTALPPWQRPAALLSALVQLLRRAERLSLERSLTHRQLGVRAVFDDDTQRQCFVRVSLLAERRLYGAPIADGGAATDSESDRVLGDGLALYAQLRTAPGGPR